MKTPLFRSYLPLTGSLLFLLLVVGFVAKITHTAPFAQLGLHLVEAGFLLNILVLTLSAGQTIWRRITANAAR